MVMKCATIVPKRVNNMLSIYNSAVEAAMTLVFRLIRSIWEMAEGY
jgi:hypothetical protein